MTGYTVPDNIEYPNDYNQPADVPAAIKAAADDTQAALTAHANTANSAVTTLRADTNAAISSVRADTTAALNAQAANNENLYVKSPQPPVITDWNAAVMSGWVRATTTTANNPATSLGQAYWVGFISRYDASHIEQVAWPVTLYPGGSWCWRAYLGSWTPWRRIQNYSDSYGTLDNMVYREHKGVRRFAEGMAKDPATANPTNVDEWRVQCYNTAGDFTWSAIKIPENGVVAMPRAHALASIALSGGEPIPADAVLTFGTLLTILGRLGISTAEVDAAIAPAIVTDVEGMEGPL